MRADGDTVDKMQVDFSLRVMQADASTPFVPFHKGSGFYAADSDKVSVFPLPAGGGLEGHSGYACTSITDDCHLIVADRSHGKLYEAFSANATENAVTQSLLRFGISTASIRPPGAEISAPAPTPPASPLRPCSSLPTSWPWGTSTTPSASYFPIREFARTSLCIPPRTPGAPRGPVDAPPMGARFRLKASFDMSKLTPAAQVVARAMQKYGMFLADGGNIALTAQNDADTKAKYADMDFGSHDLYDLKVTDFEVVEYGNAHPIDRRLCAETVKRNPVPWTAVFNIPDFSRSSSRELRPWRAVTIPVVRAPCPSLYTRRKGDFTPSSHTEVPFR
jgi:hypothetical protein